MASRSMKSLKIRMREAVLADDDIFALVGERMYPLVAQQSGVLPFITYQVVSGFVVRDFDERSDTEEIRIQIDVHDSTYEGVSGLFDRVDEVIQAWRGNLGPATGVGPVKVYQVTREAVTDLHDVEGDRRVYRITADYRLMFDSFFLPNMPSVNAGADFEFCMGGVGLLTAPVTVVPGDAPIDRVELYLGGILRETQTSAPWGFLDHDVEDLATLSAYEYRVRVVDDNALIAEDTATIRCPGV